MRDTRVTYERTARVEPDAIPDYPQGTILTLCLRCDHQRAWFGFTIDCISEMNPICRNCGSTLEGKRPPDRWERVLG